MLCTECAYARKTKAAAREMRFLCMFTGEKFDSRQNAGNCAGAMKGSWDEEKEMPHRETNGRASTKNHLQERGYQNVR